jgi:hypothetical protein
LLHQHGLTAIDFSDVACLLSWHDRLSWSQ